MKDKLKGISFVIFICTILCWKILRGQRWNILIADLEEKEGRTRYQYMLRGTGRYEFTSFHRDASNS